MISSYSPCPDYQSEETDDITLKPVGLTIDEIALKLHDLETEIYRYRSRRKGRLMGIMVKMFQVISHAWHKLNVEEEKDLHELSKGVKNLRKSLQDLLKDGW